MCAFVDKGSTNLAAKQKVSSSDTARRGGVRETIRLVPFKGAPKWSAGGFVPLYDRLSERGGGGVGGGQTNLQAQLRILHLGRKVRKTPEHPVACPLQLFQ